jgi:hypothetical protein
MSDYYEKYLKGAFERGLKENGRLHMRRRERVGRKGLVHAIAHCMDCDWECQDYLMVQRKAAYHAKTKGHRVSAELGYEITYSPIEKGKR